jgi:hypothetical protein
MPYALTDQEAIQRRADARIASGLRASGLAGDDDADEDADLDEDDDEFDDDDEDEGAEELTDEDVDTEPV